ncbi:GNAT family N-acetyltransferase [Microtetraspora sp. AC03309]|uniref:GNAT family N-acetyltransferase n=1 Tax=Microtetraspora sp. AC03309 TaxID=2779376 RepID=UPI001E523868|nr:GNAT family N-acetyltransferase [Microtetraspora sp. AC03309]MCC5576158.1 GNAT family N-acetyltransferase [Microtetraspora sp. AC03309]
MTHATGSHVVRGLQERAARALPAEHVEHAGGWWLRLAPTCSWWVGTVLPHGDAGPEELARRVGEAEEFYGRHGLDTRFQISPRACPDALDALLADRGYRRGGRMSLQAASTARVLEQASGSTRVRVDDRPAGEWFEVWHAVHGHDGEWDLLGRVERPSAYASVSVGADVIAVGRAVADDGWAGVFGMATLPRARGKGAAREVLAALAGWARTQAADRMYLQVECENHAAVRLYAWAGFQEVCGYHYRVAP